VREWASEITYEWGYTYGPSYGKPKKGVNLCVSKNVARLYGPVPPLRLEAQVGGAARIQPRQKKEGVAKCEAAVTAAAQF